MNNITNAVLVDMMDLIFGNSEVAMDVAMALEELSHHVGIKVILVYNYFSGTHTIWDRELEKCL